jgi:hypothetical protein
MSADLVRQLSALGLNLEQVAGVMDIIDAQAEIRKEKGRERWHKWKEKKDANVSQRLQTPANVSSQLTRVEDSSSKKEDNKKEKKEGRSQATRLPADWTCPTDWLDEAFTAGMSLTNAIASSRRMHNWSLSDPKGKKLDWHATWRNWFQRDLPKPHSTASPAKPKKLTHANMWTADAVAIGILDDPSNPPNQRLDASHPGGQDQSHGYARRIASA